MGADREKRLNVRSFTEEKVLKSASEINNTVQLAMAIRQNRLRSEGRFCRTTNILEKLSGFFQLDPGQRFQLSGRRSDIFILKFIHWYLLL